MKKTWYSTDETVKKWKKAATVMTAAVCISSLMTGSPVYAEKTANAEISIEKPDGWKQGETAVMVTVDDSNLGEGITISKVEAKTGEGNDWCDITSNRTVTITQNTTVYVRATDSAGNVYEQNRSIRCYDSEKPTLAAALSDGVLTIKGSDSVAGIASITVNGTAYTELEDGLLKVQLTQKDFTTKKIEIFATDCAGNVSEVYSMQNPYYEWAVKQAAQQAQAEQASGLTTTTPAEGTETEVTSPLPQDATPSEPTDAKGTVDERTVTGIEQELAETGESAESITQTMTQGGKEFYTISTKSGKIFYLIVDNDRSEDNVYFLTEVSEKDLMNFTLSDTVTLPDVDTVYATVDVPETEETEMPLPEETEQTEETEVAMPEDRSSAGSYLLIGLIMAGVGVSAYYFKIYKPKQEEDDEDEMEDDRYEDGYTEEQEEEMPDSPPVLEDEEDENEPAQ